VLVDRSFLCSIGVDQPRPVEVRARRSAVFVFHGERLAGRGKGSSIGLSYVRACYIMACIDGEEFVDIGNDSRIRNGVNADSRED